MLNFVYDDEVTDRGSSFSTWAGYDGVTKTMVIRLSNGTFMQYGDVPVDVWANYRAADSKGQAYYAYIRGKQGLKYLGVSQDTPDQLSVKKRAVKPSVAPKSSAPSTLAAVTRYTVRGEFDTFEEAAKWASYMNPTAITISVDRYEEEVN